MGTSSQKRPFYMTLRGAGCNSASACANNNLRHQQPGSDPGRTTG